MNKKNHARDYSIELLYGVHNGISVVCRGMNLWHKASTKIRFEQLHHKSWQNHEEITKAPNNHSKNT